MVDPLCRAGVAGDLGVEDEQGVLKIGDMGTNALPMLFEQLTAFGFRARAAFPQGGIAQHVPDWHPGRFQPTYEFDPCQDRQVIVSLARTISVSMREQTDPLVVTDRVGGQPRAPGEFTDLHDNLLRSDAADATT